MTLVHPHLNGIAPRPAPAAPRSSGRAWLLMVVGLLAMNASIVAATVFFAVRDDSAATEPNYYAKAVAYGDTIRLREAGKRLGWKAEPTLRPAADGLSMELAVTVTDRDGVPIDGAAVTAEAFANARSGDRQSLQLARLAGGEYAAPVRITRSGLWRVRLLVRRADDAFAYETDLLVPDRSN